MPVPIGVRWGESLQAPVTREVQDLVGVDGDRQAVLKAFQDKCLGAGVGEGGGDPHQPLGGHLDGRLGAQPGLGVLGEGHDGGRPGLVEAAHRGVVEAHPGGAEAGGEVRSVGAGSLDARTSQPAVGQLGEQGTVDRHVHGIAAERLDDAGGHCRRAIRGERAQIGAPVDDAHGLVGRGAQEKGYPRRAEVDECIGHC